MTDDGLLFNPPPGWPKPPASWRPPKGWVPDPSWPPPPSGWELWVSQRADDSGMESPAFSDASHLQEAKSASGQEPGLPTTSDAQRILLLESELRALRRELEERDPDSEVVVLDDERVLQQVGIYRYHHPLENAAAFKERLTELSSRIAEVVKTNGAIESSNLFTFDNSLAKGRRMCRDLGKLMLRAYNAEADNSIRTLRFGNVHTAKKRLEASRTAIARLGSMMEMRISDIFHSLRLKEIELTSDYLMMKQEEREAAREERARLREEKRVAAELAAERERLDKEREHLLNALAALNANGESDSELEKRLAVVDGAIEQNDFRAANVRAGYVYVISNRGSFGEGVVKIGLTRRLEPIDRVNELGGASVPFRFDVHGLFFSENAVTLENELHHHFSDRRVNHANSRKEFFFARPSEVRSVLMSKIGNLLEFTERAEAQEYLQSLRYWPDERRPGGRAVDTETKSEPVEEFDS